MNDIARKPQTMARDPADSTVYSLPEAVLSPPSTGWEKVSAGSSLDQRLSLTFILSRESPDAEMFYVYGVSYIGTMTETNRFVRMYQAPKLEFVVNRNLVEHRDKVCRYHPSRCTNFGCEMTIGVGNSGGYSHKAPRYVNHRMIVYQRSVIAPLHESKSDYWILGQLAERLVLKKIYRRE